MKEEGERKPVEIVIMGQKLPLGSDHDPEYVKKVADFVDKKMREIESKSGSVSSLNIAILAALTIADEYFSFADKQRHTLEGLMDKSKRLISFIDERLD